MPAVYLIQSFCVCMVRMHMCMLSFLYCMISNVCVSLAAFLPLHLTISPLHTILHFVRAQNICTPTWWPLCELAEYHEILMVILSEILPQGMFYHRNFSNNLLLGQGCASNGGLKLLTVTCLCSSFQNLGIQCVKKRELKESIISRITNNINPFSGK